MIFNPHRYQRRAIARAIALSHMLILLDPGLGKTVIMLTVFEHLRQEFNSHKMLVIAPLAVCYNVWRQEVEKWDHLQHLGVGLLHGKNKAKVLAEEHDIYLINPEGVEWLVRQKWRAYPDMLVIDESTKFKKPGTKRFKALRKILGKFTRRYALTGTPIPNGLLDLFGQAYCVDQGATLGRSMTEYKQAYFIPIQKGDYYEWIPRHNAATDIYNKLGPLALRLEGSELDLPDLVVVDVPIELPPKARRLYDDLRTDMVACIDQGAILALNAGALTAKCRQVANGSIYCDDVEAVLGSPAPADGVVDGREYAVVHRAKEEALGRLVEELGGKSVLIGYEFKHDLESIRRVLGKVPQLKGTDTALVTEWNRGLIPAMACHPASVGHGLNLQAGGHVLIWYGPPYNLELYDQLIKRLHRQGQEGERVLVYRFVARGTVDEVAARVLGTKDADQRGLLDALKEDVL